MPRERLALLLDTNSRVLELCGLAGFTIVWFVPAALQHAARRASVRRWGEAGRVTPHSSCLSGPATVAVVTVAGVGAFAYNLVAVAASLSATARSIRVE